MSLPNVQPPMNADERRCMIDALTEEIIKAAFQVSNVLGSGFLEKVYENALTYELRKCGRLVEQQQLIDVHYDKAIVGQYVADLVVEQIVLVEIKAVKCFDDIHLAQCLNYLKATGKPVCLLINFGKPRVEIKRIVNNF
jgi:GxxExxY protein